jgi:lipoprotein-releasing system permease protein
MNDTAAKAPIAPANPRRPAPRGAGAFSRFELMVALRYLRSRRSDSFISIIAGISFLGIALGVAILIIVMSVMNGFREELLGKIIGLQGHMLVQGIDGKLTDFDAIAARVRKVPGVTRAAPIIDGEVLASSRAGSTGALVRGIRQSDLKSLTVVSSTLFDNQVPDESQGNDLTVPPELKKQKGDAWDAHRAAILSRFAGTNAVIVGAGLADQLGIALGDSIKLTSPNGAQTPFGLVPRSESYQVVGFFRMGMSEYDSRVIFMPLDAAQAFFNLGDAVSALEIMVNDPEGVAAMRTPIYHAVGTPANVVDWQELNSSFFSALQVERNVMFLILTFIILIAALNVISGLLMFVKDKGEDIAILRTMGATSGAVMRIFFIAGASIGVFGTLGGLILGTVFCANIESIREFLQNLTGVRLFDSTIYFLSEIPSKMDPHEVIAVVAMALTLSFLATLIPSWRAARLDPVDALRYE